MIIKKIMNFIKRKKPRPDNEIFVEFINKFIVYTCDIHISQTKYGITILIIHNGAIYNKVCALHIQKDFYHVSHLTKQSRLLIKVLVDPMIQIERKMFLLTNEELIDGLIKLENYTNTPIISEIEDLFR